MFVRLKKLKGKNYAYLVQNKWTKLGSRQKTKKYLGRCVEISRNEKFVKMDILSYYKLDVEKFVYGNSTKGILAKLVEFELLKYGFKYEKDLMVNGDVISIPKRLKIYSKEGKNDLVLKINEGYLCKYMLDKILKFKFKGDDSDGYKFADSFVAAGIDVDKEIFIEIFRKLTNQ